MTGGWLEWMILEVFSSLGYSVILCAGCSDDPDLLTSRTGCRLFSFGNNITSRLKWTALGLVLCLWHFPVTDAK